MSKIFKLNSNFDFKLNNNLSFFVVKGLFGLFIIRLPLLYFINYNKICLNIIMYDNIIFWSIFGNIISLYKQLNLFFFAKLKLKGLGFRIKQITNNLFRFFFNAVNYIYMHTPANIIIKIKKKNLLILSNNLCDFKKVFHQILLLKTFGAYSFRGFMYTRQIIVLKVGKKNT